MKRSLVLACCLTLLCHIALTRQQAGWRKAAGADTFYATGLDLYEGDPDTLYAIGSDQSSQIKKVLLSTDRGESWDSISPHGTPFGLIRVCPINSKILFSSIIEPIRYYDVVYRSIDGGQTWVVLFGGGSNFVNSQVIEIDPADPYTIYAAHGQGYLHRSTDGGISWIWLDSMPTSNITSLAIAPSQDSIVYRGSSGSVFKSTDKGQTWLGLSLGASVSDLRCLAVDPRNADIVYAGIFSFGDTPGGIFKSTDGGMNWTEKNNGLESTNWQINAIKINPKNPDEIFIGTGGATNEHIMRSIDGGNNWTSLSEGLPQGGHVESITIDTLNGRVCIGGSFGIYIHEGLTEVENRKSEIPQTSLLYQNYPNPFNPSTAIQYDIRREGLVVLKVYDLLGQEIAVLLDERKAAGSYTVKWNAGDRPSGTYFYRMITGSLALTGRMVLSK